MLAWAAVALFLFPHSAGAQPVRSRFLVGLDTRQHDGGWDVIVEFSTPVRYLRHAPLGRARSLHIQLAILRSELGAVDRVGRESLGIGDDSPGPLRSADVEVFEGNRAQLDLHFDTPDTFEVWQGEDFRSLSIRIGPPQLIEPGEPPDGVSESRDSVLMSEARRALTAHDQQRAILILREILSLPESDNSRDARELLGLAHERSSQRAHAVAEYRAFLDLYPHGPQAQRVRQRLEALLTSGDRPKASKVRVRAEESPLDWDMLGSLYLGYRRESMLGDEGEIPLDNSLFTDLQLRSRVRTDRWNFRSEFSGGYRNVFLDSDDTETRINRLFGRIEHEGSGLSATLGRQTRSSGGVLGRFDGLLAGWEFLPGAELSIVGGFPTDSAEPKVTDFGRYFFGASLDGSRLFGWLDAQAFFIDQQSSGYEERRAIGGELRFVQASRFASAYVDYDLLFQSLNIAQLTANWNVTPETFVNLLIDYRNSPILTLTNGLISQPETDLGRLADRLSMDEIQKLAEDSTARSTMVNIGVSQRITERIQLAGDFTLSRFSQIAQFEDLEGFGGGGFEYTYQGQVLVTDLFRPGDSATGGLRFFDGNAFRSMVAAFDLRWPIQRILRLNPRLRVETRWGSDASRLTALRPSIRGDLSVWKFVFDVDCGVEWRTPKREGRWGYYTTVGARFDF